MAGFAVECDAFQRQRGSAALPRHNSGRKKIEGHSVGFARGNAETQFGAGITWMEMLAEMVSVELGHDLLPVFGVSQVTDKHKIALEPILIE